MPIYFVIYSLKMLQNGCGIKEVHYCIPTTFENVNRIYDKYKPIMYNANPPMQCDYWARHDESLLANAAKGE